MNWIIFLWQVLFCISVLTCIIGMVRRSAWSMLISCVSCLPVSYYFLGAENWLRVIGLLPVVSLVLAIFFWRKAKKID